MRQSSMPSGALFEVSGAVANNATWQETIYFMQSGSPMVLTGLSFKITFRCDGERTNADYTLSTDDGTLSIVADADSGIANNLYINVAAGSLSGLRGDYVCDLASQDVSDVVTLWGHGNVTFSPNPVTF